LGDATTQDIGCWLETFARHYLEWWKHLKFFGTTGVDPVTAGWVDAEQEIKRAIWCNSSNISYPDAFSPIVQGETAFWFRIEERVSMSVLQHKAQIYFPVYWLYWGIGRNGILQ
jgi:hypothetical protein